MDGIEGADRIYTLLVYLNDVDAGAGGETVFKYADGAWKKVLPRKGRALLWPNTLDTDPAARDHATMHAAAPLRHGVKHAANLWLRQRKFQLDAAWSSSE